jgi:hypothetical protein
MLPYTYCPLFHKHTFLLYHPREEREKKKRETKEEEKEEGIYHNYEERKIHNISLIKISLLYTLLRWT